MCGEIKSKEELRRAYQLLYMCKELGYTEDGEKIKGIKGKIRSYHKIQSKERLVKDDGIDGYITLMELSEYLENKEEAEAYFEERLEMRALPSIYDCTGQAFTEWVKIFRRGTRFMAYHRISFDV